MCGIAAPWLTEVLQYPVRFVVRWTKAYRLKDDQGARKAWQITRGKHFLDWDARRKCWRKTGIYFCEVTHPTYPTTLLWLVVSWPGKGKTPLYLLTNEPVMDVDTTWRIVLIYMRRWQVEMSFRFTKTELLCNPRVCGIGTLVSSCSCSWHSSTLFYCHSWSPISRPSIVGCSVTLTIAQASGTFR